MALEMNDKSEVETLHKEIKQLQAGMHKFFKNSNLGRLRFKFSLISKIEFFVSTELGYFKVSLKILKGNQKIKNTDCVRHKKLR